MKISEISIKRPSVVIISFLLLLLGGIASYFSLGYELVPKLDINTITIQTVYPGASPEEVESSVTKIIEDGVGSLENVKKIESKSYEGVSVVIITLNTGSDVNFLLTDAQRKVNAVVNDLPEDAKEPIVNKFSLDDMPIMNLSITSNVSDKELFDLIDKKLDPIFARINGVARTTIVGGEEREIQVSMYPEKLEAYGLTGIQVQQIIAASNMDFPTGNVQTQDNITTIRLSGKIQSIEQFRNLPITTSLGATIRLSDVADVQDGVKDISKIARVDRKNTILMQIYKQSDANAVEVSKAVQKTMQTIEKDYQEQGVKLSIANDTTDYTVRAANNVMHDLMIAIILVAFIMLFFLHSLRDAAIATIAIPLSLIATFIGLYLLGYTLNLMSLLGLSLVVGILVDDAIVVIENIHRHLEMGKNKVRAAYDGAKEIGFTVTAITTVIVVVFLPIALSTSFVSDILRQFCVTVVVSTLLSLFVSFTVVPWLYSRFGKLSHISNATFFGKILHGFDAGITAMTNFISGILKWSLKSKVTKLVTLSITAVLFFGSILLVSFGYIGSSFFPEDDKEEFLLQFELDKDASLEKTNIFTQTVEDYLVQLPEIKKIVTTVGQSSDGTGGGAATKYKSEIQVELQEGHKDKEPTEIYAAKLRRQLQMQFESAKIKIVKMGLFGAQQAPISLTVMGANREDALEFAEKAAELLHKIPGSSDVKITSENGTPEIAVKLDRDKMNTLGLNVASVGTVMQNAFAGNNKMKYKMGDSQYDINVRYDQAGRASIDDVRELKFMNNRGEIIKLSQFADISFASGPSFLERSNKTPSVTIQSQVMGKSEGQLSAEWEAQFTKLDKKAGISFRWGGNKENQEEGFGTLGIALIAAILLVYSVMVILYDSFSKPFIILFSIPLSFIGALLFLALTNETLNVFTILGIIMLIGLVAKNAIMLVDFANQRINEGESVYNALIEANHIRFRPILMTTIAMVIGMIPIATATGDGADANRGLAIVIIGGLLSSLFLTLIVVPVIYSIFDSIGKRFGKQEKTDYEKLMFEEK